MYVCIIYFFLISKRAIVVTHLDGVRLGHGNGDLNMYWIGPVDRDRNCLGLDDGVGLGHWHGDRVRFRHCNWDL